MEKTNKAKKRVEYKSMDQRSHVLHRPDMYIGSVVSTKQDTYIADRDTFKISKKNIEYNPGLDRIFIEVLSNAIDNVWRSQEFDVETTKIKVNINTETGETSIWNDGLAIPCEKNTETGLYNVEMIFGKLLTSSNYNDEEERKTSGRNGLGVKLSSIYSQKFTVKSVDPKSEKMYEQTWEENMSKRNDPKIKNCKLKTGFTEVSWIPDFKRFGFEGYTPDMLSVYYKHIIDAAMITKVGVYLNDVKIPVKSLSDYAKLYIKEKTEQDDEDNEDEDEVEEDEEDKGKKSRSPKTRKRGENLLYITHEGSEVVLTPNDYDDFDAISFVNGVETYKGGVHVDSWSNALLKPVLEKLNNATKKGTPTLTMKDVKQFFRIFLNCSVTNPVFTSQEKTELASPNVKVNVENKHITSIMRWSVIEKIKDIIRGKELLALKKTEKKKGFKKIEGYDPANHAGEAKFSKDCTLILCEGLSAKTYAVQGIEVGAFGNKGRDWFGIYPLRGKILNTRNACTTSIAKNREITDIIQALNLKFGVDYTEDKNFTTLNYGRIMLLTDSDVDGYHISGLLMNMFHSLFPTLLQRNDPFIITMKTPIVRIYFKGGKDICFYSLEEFKKYHNENENIKGTIKYYKGLGTSNDKEVRDTFGKKMVEYYQDDKTDETINKAFHTKYSNARKEWLAKYDPNISLLENESNKNKVMSSLSFTKFIDQELIKFSIDDCKRSIPHLMDGLKESQRKILYACFLKNLKYTGKVLKVAQLSGFVAEKTNYHHGEQNLFDTITKMAHDFPGSNNIPLLFRDGQFGTRLNGGKDAASARYIFTKLDYLTRLIFRPEDDVLLDHIEDDGEIVEPKFYVPIIPTILVNGCNAGIGTGWSCSVPNFNPLELVDCIKIWLEDNNVFEDDTKSISKLPEIKPWYRNFQGIIEKVDDCKYTTYGTLHEEKDGKIIVDELPIGLWTDKFKETVEELLEKKEIKSYKNYSTTEKVHFQINETKNGLRCNRDNLKLKTHLSTNNMVLFTENGILKKFPSLDEIIDNFCRVRFGYYIKRKEHILHQLREDLKYTNNRFRFLSEVMNNELIIHKRDEKVIILELEQRGYDKKVSKREERDEKDGEDEDDKGSYRYLLDMKIRSFTKEKLEELQKEIDNLIQKVKVLESTSEKDLWMSDLQEFSEAYEKYFKGGKESKKVIKGKKKSDNKDDEEDEEEEEDKRKVVKKIVKKIQKGEEEEEEEVAKKKVVKRIKKITS